MLRAGDGGTYQNEDVARRAGAAKWQQLQRGTAEFSITLVRGRAELYPEMHVTMSGFKDEIDTQDWVIARVEHAIDDNGFTTRLELEARKYLTGLQKLNKMQWSSIPKREPSLCSDVFSAAPWPAPAVKSLT